MGSSQSEKRASHQRIIAITAAHMRQDGFEGVRVADVMAEAGLTHGGFYRHFNTRDELVTEALEYALTEGSERSREAAKNLGPSALRAIINGYLSKTHRDTPADGCAVAALAEDVARSNESSRELYEKQVREYIDLLESLEKDSDNFKSSMAILTLSALVGAVNLARAVSDDDFSLRILRETQEALLEILRS